MSGAGSYILNFASIILGLAVADMLMDLDRLLRARRRVRWHALPVIAFAFVLMVLVAAWWELYDLSATRTMTVALFLPYFAKLILIFLLSAAVLPSEWEGNIDLGQYYFANARYFFGIWWLLSVLILFMPTMQGEGLPSLGFVVALSRGLIGMLVLALFRKPLVHWLVLPALFVLFTWQWFDRAIGI